jgi:hypothetical protein
MVAREAPEPSTRPPWPAAALLLGRKVHKVLRVSLGHRENLALTELSDHPVRKGRSV